MKKALLFLLLVFMVLNVATIYHTQIMVIETCTEVEQMSIKEDKKEIKDLVPFGNHQVSMEAMMGNRPDLFKKKLPTAPFSKQPSPPPDVVELY